MNCPICGKKMQSLDCNPGYECVHCQTLCDGYGNIIFVSKNAINLKEVHPWMIGKPLDTK
jgi:tRNA(Ile2) C34 agmatinyltransferase TiaS